MGYQLTKHPGSTERIGELISLTRKNSELLARLRSRASGPARFGDRGGMNQRAQMKKRMFRLADTGRNGRVYFLQGASRTSVCSFGRIVPSNRFVRDTAVFDSRLGER